MLNTTRQCRARLLFQGHWSLTPAHFPLCTRCLHYSYLSLLFTRASLLLSAPTTRRAVLHESPNHSVCHQCLSPSAPSLCHQCLSSAPAISHATSASFRPLPSSCSLAPDFYLFFSLASSNHVLCLCHAAPPFLSPLLHSTMSLHACLPFPSMHLVFLPCCLLHNFSPSPSFT